MKRISPENVQMFVAGALAISGIRDVFELPYYFVSSTHAAFIDHSILSSISLMIGISILIGSSKAVCWAIIFLALSVLFALSAMIYSLSHKAAAQTPYHVWKTISSSVMSASLFVLLLWSRSKYSKNEPAD